MCPFDDDDELSKLKPKAISLWYEHQSVVGKHAKVQAERDALAARVKELEAQLARKNKALFGPTSERSKKDPASAEPAASPEPSSSPQEKPKQKGHGRREQPKLRVEPVEHTLEGDELLCDQCGGTFVLFEGQEETSREIDLLRREFVELLHKRLKYRCPCGACIRTAKAPLKLKEGNLYSIKFGAHVAAQKYDQHQPLERQARVMGSEGLVIDSQTLWDQTDSVAFWSIGAYNAIKAQVLSAEVVGADETQWRLMDTTSDAKTHSSKWWVWAVRAPNAVVYHLDEHRSKDAAATLLSTYHGVVMCDGYAAYSSLAKQFPDVLLAHCWSHIRREFYAIEESAAGASEGMLSLIDELFAIDREAKKLGAQLLEKATSDGERALAQKGAEAMLRHARSDRSTKVLAQLSEKAFAIGLMNSKESALYKACAKMVNQWEGLVLFARHPSVPLHNNATEQSQRGPVIGRNNHQGSRSERGTRVSAILYTLVESAKLAGVDPERYLLLCVRRALMDKSPVTPSEVTTAMLVEDCELSEEQARSALTA
jgi:transposase